MASKIKAHDERHVDAASAPAIRIVTNAYIEKMFHFIVSSIGEFYSENQFCHIFV